MRSTAWIALVGMAFVAGHLDPAGRLLAALGSSYPEEAKAASREGPSAFEAIPREEWLAESERAFAVRDCASLAPTHVLVVPKERFPSLLETPEDVLAEMLGLAKRVARQEGVAESGFRLVINTHPDAWQTVYHTHVHVLGGERLDVPIYDYAWALATGRCAG